MVLKNLIEIIRKWKVCKGVISKIYILFLFSVRQIFAFYFELWREVHIHVSKIIVNIFAIYFVGLLCLSHNVQGWIMRKFILHYFIKACVNYELFEMHVIVKWRSFWVLFQTLSLSNYFYGNIFYYIYFLIWRNI